MNKLTFLCRMYSATVKAPGAIGIERSQQFVVVVSDMLHIADHLAPVKLYDQVLDAYVKFRKNNPDGLAKLRFTKQDVVNFSNAFSAIEHHLMHYVDSNAWRNFNKKYVWITNDTQGKQAVSLHRERAKRVQGARHYDTRRVA